MTRQPYIYTMPEGFLNDPSIGVKWKIYAIINGFWISGKTCYAANKYFSERLGVSERQIRNGISQLEQDGYLERVINGNGRLLLPKAAIYEEAEAGLPGGGSQSSAEAEARVPHISISNSISNSSAYAQVKDSSEDEDTARPSKPPKYPHARQVFAWFPKPEKSWYLDTIQNKHAELLYERGEKAVKGALSFAAKHQDYEDIPQILKPSDLERKWNELKAFAKRNGL